MPQRKAEEIACSTKLTLPSFAPTDGIASSKADPPVFRQVPIQFRKHQRGPVVSIVHRGKAEWLKWVCNIIKNSLDIPAD